MVGSYEILLQKLYLNLKNCLKKHQDQLTTTTHKARLQSMLKKLKIEPSNSSILLSSWILRPMYTMQRRKRIKRQTASKILSGNGIKRYRYHLRCCRLNERKNRMRFCLRCFNGTYKSYQKIFRWILFSC